MAKFKAGDKAYILENNRIIREVTIVRYSGGLYLIRFNSGGGIQVKEHRLFVSEEEAAANVPKPISKVDSQRKGFRSPYDYDH